MGEARRSLGSILEGFGGARLEKLTLHGLGASLGALGLSRGLQAEQDESTVLVKR